MGRSNRRIVSWSGDHVGVKGCRFVTPAKVCFPLVEGSEPVALIFVPQVVDGAAEGVYRAEMVALVGRQEP